MHILLYLIASFFALFNLATLAWGCLLAWRRTRSAQLRQAGTQAPLSVAI